MPEATVIKFYTPVNEASIPAQVTTHNIGSVDSIGVGLYCARQLRLSLPQSRFLMHRVSMNFREGTRYEEPKLVELVKSLRVDTENCGSLVAVNTPETQQQIFGHMLARTTLDPEQALDWGLVHEIRRQLFAEGSEVIPIQAGG